MKLPLWAWSNLLTTVSVLVLTSITLSVTLTITSRVVLSATSAHVESRLGSTLFAVQRILRRPVVAGKLIINVTKLIGPSSGNWTMKHTRHLVNILSDVTRVPSLDVVYLYWLLTDGSRFCGSVHRLEHEGDEISILERAIGTRAITRTVYNLSSLTTIDNATDPRIELQYAFGSDTTDMNASLRALGAFTGGGVNTIWSPPLVFSSGYTGGDGTIDFEFLLTLYTPLKLGNHTFGYVLPAASLESMSSVLLSFVKTVPCGASFLLDAFGYLMASSLQSQLAFVNTTTVRLGTVGNPLTGCDSLNSHVWGAASPSNTSQLMTCRAHMSVYDFPPLNALAAAAPMFPFSDALQSIAYTVGTDCYFAASQRVPAFYANLNLFLVVIMPQSELSGDVDASRNLAIGLVVIIVVALVVVSAVALYWLLQPLRRLANELPLGTLVCSSTTLADPSSDGPVSSCVMASELMPVSVSYGAMTSELQRIRAFVPDATRQQLSRSASPLAEPLDSNIEQHPAFSSSSLGDAETPRPQTPHAKYAAFPSEEDSAPLREGDPEGEVGASTSNNNQSLRPEATLSSSLRRSVSFATVERFAVGDMYAAQQSLVCLLFGNPAAAPSTAHGSLLRDAASALQESTRAIVTLVHDVATRYKGTMRVFLGDHVMIEFRDAKRAPLVTACEAAMALLGSEQLAEARHWTIAVEAGLGMVGAVGSVAMSTMHMIGKNYEVYHLALAARMYRRRSVTMSARHVKRLLREAPCHFLGDGAPWALRRLDVIDIAMVASHFGPSNMRPQHLAEISLADTRCACGHRASSAVLDLREQLLDALLDDVVDERGVERIRNCLRAAVGDDARVLDHIDVCEYLRMTDVPMLRYLAEADRYTALSTEDAMQLIRRVVPVFPTTRDLLRYEKARIALSD